MSLRDTTGGNGNDKVRKRTDKDKVGKRTDKDGERKCDKGGEGTDKDGTRNRDKGGNGTDKDGDGNTDHGKGNDKDGNGNTKGNDKQIWYRGHWYYAVGTGGGLQVLFARENSVLWTNWKGEDAHATNKLITNSTNHGYLEN